MIYHIENDKNAENFEGSKGRGLDWTLYDGDLVHEFFETQEEAEAEFEDIMAEQRARIRRLSDDLEEAEFDLEEMLTDQSAMGDSGSRVARFLEELEEASMFDLEEMPEELEV